MTDIPLTVTVHIGHFSTSVGDIIVSGAMVPLEIIILSVLVVVVVVVCVMITIFICFYRKSQRKSVSIAMHEQTVELVATRYINSSSIVTVFLLQFPYYRNTQDLEVTDGNTALVSKFLIYIRNYIQVMHCSSIH